MAGRPADRLVGRVPGAAGRQQFRGQGLRVGDVQRAHGRAHDAEHVRPGAAGARWVGADLEPFAVEAAISCLLTSFLNLSRS